MKGYTHLIGEQNKVRIVIHLLLLLGMTILAPGTSMVMAHSAQSYDPPQRLPGNLVPMLLHVRTLGPTDPQKHLQLSIMLKFRNMLNLDTLLSAQADPKSPLYQHFLTPQEFTNQFGPSTSTVASVISYIHSQNLAVASVSSNRLLINITGTVKTTETAFNTHLHDYRLRGRIVYAPSINPAIPADLLDSIATISGLNNVPNYHPLNLRTQHKPAYHQIGPAGGFSPSDLRTAYNAQPLLNTGADGTGQSIGLFELDGYDPADINTYLQQFKLGTPKYSDVLVDGSLNYAGRDAIEVETDMEVVSALAPGAQQKIYIGPNSTVGESDIYNQMVTDDSVKIIATSWGECEAATTPARLDALDNIFKQGAAEGQSFFAASGDSGAYDCNDTNLAVDSPADDPHVVGVGGTSLQLSTPGTPRSEVTWEDETNTDSGPQGTGGGGGLSTHFLRYSDQRGRNLTNTYRMVPDVSAVADPVTGYAIFCSVGGSAGWITIGGTSAAAPLWAAMMLDTNQYLIAQGQKGLGNTIGSLYRLYNTPQLYPPYYDITSGTNLYYSAGPGYDLASGLGSPNIWNIARDLIYLVPASSVPDEVSIQLLQNGGFEQGSTYWNEQSKGGVEMVDPTNPHSGTYSAYLCGYHNCADAIFQTVTLPLLLKNATLSYWISTSAGKDSPLCPDNIISSLRTSQGVPIIQLQKLCNTRPVRPWALYNYDVTLALKAYAGQSVQIYFEAVKTDNERANFFIDDLSFNVTYQCPAKTACS